MILVGEMPKEKVVFIGLHYEGPPKSKYKLDGTPIWSPIHELFSLDPFCDLTASVTSFLLDPK